jgi:hypothetical protein
VGRTQHVAGSGPWAASDVKSVVKYAKTEYRELYDGAPQLAEKYGYPKFPHMKMVKP